MKTIRIEYLGVKKVPHYIGVGQAGFREEEVFQMTIHAFAGRNEDFTFYRSSVQEWPKSRLPSFRDNYIKKGFKIPWRAIKQGIPFLYQEEVLP